MKILVAVDFSPIGTKVVAEGYRMAQKDGTQPVFFTCLPKMSDFFAGYAGLTRHPAMSTINKEEEKKMKQEAKEKIKELIAAAEKKYGPLTGAKEEIVLGNGVAADEIIKLATEDKEYKDIIIGYKSHNALSTLLVGSTAAKVARYAPCTVIIYRP